MPEINNIHTYILEVNKECIAKVQEITLAKMETVMYMIQESDHGTHWPRAELKE